MMKMKEILVYEGKLKEANEEKGLMPFDLGCDSLTLSPLGVRKLPVVPRKRGEVLVPTHSLYAMPTSLNSQFLWELSPFQAQKRPEK